MIITPRQIDENVKWQHKEIMGPLFLFFGIISSVFDI